MLRLVLMRHAKSSHSIDYASDHERELTSRGRRNACQIGQHLVKIGWVPQLVLASTSTRTRQTWQAVVDYCPDVVDCWFSDALYLSGWDELSAALLEVPDGLNTVLALGHNPGWESIAGMITGQPVVMKTSTALLAQSTADTWTEAAGSIDHWSAVELIHAKELG